MTRFEQFYTSNGDGWELALRRCIDPEHLETTRRPLFIVPGYGMNSHIFGYHPSGPSLMESLATMGFEVWTADLRNQGGSRCVGGSKTYRIEDAACVDVSVVIQHILEHTDTDGERVDLIGCSLGGTYAFVHLTCVPDARVGAVVAMGSPLRWVDPSAFVRILFKSPWLAGAIPMKGVRDLAKVVFPVLLKFPRLVNLYLHPDHVDTHDTDELVRTVDDPSPVLNRQLAEWIAARDLYVRGINVTEALQEVTNPLLVVLANADGIVPVETTLSAYHAVGSTTKDIHWVGDEFLKFAHADLFISTYAQEAVFKPVGRWLERLYLMKEQSA